MSTLEILQLPRKLRLFYYRIQIIKLLSLKKSVSGKELREDLNLSDGFMWSHIRALESDGLLKINKEIRGRKVTTSYSITTRGSEVFNNFRDAVMKILA